MRKNREKEEEEEEEEGRKKVVLGFAYELSSLAGLVAGSSSSPAFFFSFSFLSLGRTNQPSGSSKS